MFRRKRIVWSLGISIAFICAACWYVSGYYMLPIAMYHSVAPSVPAENRLVVSARTFERQMQFLRDHRYNVLTLEQAASAIREKNIPPRAIVLTFDDGNEDNYIYAFPVLKKYSFPATVFLIVSEIGKPGRLNWGQIKEMQASGLISFGSHTMTHPFLETISSDETLAMEISRSRQLLEQELGRPVRTFSYPCGRFTERVKSFVQDAGYSSAVVTNPGSSCPDDDIFALKRLRISENAANMFIFWAETSGYYNFLRERRHK